jgi:hypothetical protein
MLVLADSEAAANAIMHSGKPTFEIHLYGERHPDSRDPRPRAVPGGEECSPTAEDTTAFT